MSLGRLAAQRMPALLLVAVLFAAQQRLAASATDAAAAPFSDLWGRSGERWNPAGLLPDFSFAGYKQGNEVLPRPPVTRKVADFRTSPSMSDTAMLKAAIAWAQRQPLTDDWIVLGLPAGTLTLTESLFIRRSKLVLRGAGLGSTILSVPKSLTQVYGKNKGTTTGGYVFDGGFVTFQGDYTPGKALARVQAAAAKGSRTVQVERPGALRVGQYYDLWWTDVNGKFNNAQFDNQLVAPSQYRNQMRYRFVAKVMAIKGNSVTLERHLPYAIRAGVNTVEFYQGTGAVRDSGLEDLTFSFRWEWYGGHHVEKGWNAVYVVGCTDCWVRNIGTINADSGVLMMRSTSVTVTGLRMEVSKTRANKIPNVWKESADYDGHWGAQMGHSFDILVEKFDIRCSMVHDMGTDTSAKFVVFMDGKMKDGNLDLHRGLSGPSLYTNIDVGKGTNALASGGPQRSGPNAAAGTTWWNIISNQPVDPPKSNGGPAGSCMNFGPVINLVGVNIKPNKVGSMCPTWKYERSVKQPANLYTAQLQRRRAAA